MLFEAAAEAGIAIGEDVGVVDGRDGGSLDIGEGQAAAVDLGVRAEGIVEGIGAEAVVVIAKGAAETEVAGELVFCEATQIDDVVGAFARYCASLRRTGFTRLRLLSSVEL